MELRGKTVLITRAPTQADELREGLVGLGAKVIELPTIELVPVEDWTAIDQAIANVNSYQWLLFTSANAVNYFMERMEKVKVGCKVPIAVVGSATAEKVKKWGLLPAFIPTSFRAEGLLEAFPSDLRGVRILFPRAERAREVLPEELRRRGAVVDVLIVYRAVSIAGGERDLRDVLHRERIDCVVFTSSASIRFLADSVGDHLQSILNNTPVAVIGPVTRGTAEAFGLNASIMPVQATIPDLVESIRQSLVG